MELRDLKVLHWRGAHVSQAPAPTAPAGQDCFLIDTCQRRVALVLGEQALAAARSVFPADGALESFEGLEAYAFLLRFACGLESKLTAETEIFGQIMEAWREFSERGSPLTRQLSPWIQLIFQDAKAIRAQWLANIGGASYGSQVRRLLGDQPSGPTLLIGAGQLAQAVAPWLGGSALWIWNRTRARAEELAREVAKRAPTRSVSVIDPDHAAELDAWRRAQNVVLCIPSDPQLDAERVQAWRSGRATSELGTDGAAEPGKVIHLGLAADAVTPWSEVPELVSLGSLFEMLRTHSEQRQRAFDGARRGCREKALLRSLGAHSSTSHSWEDLAAFHSL